MSAPTVNSWIELHVSGPAFTAGTTSNDTATIKFSDNVVFLEDVPAVQSLRTALAAVQNTEMPSPESSASGDGARISRVSVGGVFLHVKGDAFTSKVEDAGWPVIEASSVRRRWRLVLCDHAAVRSLAKAVDTALRTAPKAAERDRLVELGRQYEQLLEAGSAVPTC